MNEQRLKNKGKLYWILNISGWSTFFLIYSWVGATFILNHWKIYVAYLISAFIGLVITHLYRGVAKQNHLIKLPIKQIAGLIILSSIAMGAIWASTVYPINKFLLRINELSDLPDLSKGAGIINTIISVIFQYSIIMFIWCILYFGVNFFYHFRESEIEKWKLSSMVREAELQALKSQINPHFIFNSLNNIRSLVLEDPEKARSMITNLSGLLRYSVQFSRQEKVKLEEELSVVKNYLKLESIQYEDRLRYTLEVNEETLDFKIPPMVIQILVENAIKHGVAELPAGGEVCIRSHLSGNDLVVEVINSGSLKEEVVGTGIGLKNASERLNMLFGKMSSLSIENIEGNKVMAKFSVPIVI